MCEKKGHWMADCDLLKLLIKNGEELQQDVQPGCSEAVPYNGLEVEGEAPTSPREDPQTSIKVGARGATVATTSRTWSREWWKKGTIPSPMLNSNPLYLFVGPISVAEVEVNDVTTRALLDTGTTTNVMTLVVVHRLGEILLKEVGNAKTKS